MAMLLPKLQSELACYRIRNTIYKSIKDTDVRFRLLIMGLVSHMEWEDINTPPDVLFAWSVLTSDYTYTVEHILHIIRHISDDDLRSLIVHGIYYCDIENSRILDCDDVDIMY